MATSNGAAILQEIGIERERQDAKWGEQNHPIIPDNSRRMSLKFYQQETSFWKNMCDTDSKQGSTNWEAILLEEVYEALEQAALGNQANLREELVQVAGVVVAMIESLDRNGLH